MAGKKKTVSNKPPYNVQIGDRMFPNDPTPLKNGEVYRRIVAKSEPYLVQGAWKVLIEDLDNSKWYAEAPLKYFHVVGENQKPVKRTAPKPPKLKKGDIVQLRNCPRYPSTESHKAKLTGDPFENLGVWQAPIEFNCYGPKTAIVDCNRMAFLGHSRLEMLVDKIRSKVMKLSKPAVVTLAVLAFVAVLGLWCVGNYNSLVGAKNAVDNSKAKIDTQLTRRYELIDNIVQSVQGSQAQESDVFGKIAEARKIGGSSAASTEQQAEANQTIDTQIALLPRLQEAYPELKSNDQVSKLITELQGTANSVREARDFYNNTVTNYNTNITSFPKNIFAGVFNFDKAKLFEASAQEKVNPKVELDREKN